MLFNLSLSTSATVVTSASVNGNRNGWAYRRESYANNNGSGVRTTRQNLGQPPVMQTMVYDAYGRPLLVDGSSGGNGSGSGTGTVSGRRRNTQRVPTSRIISIEDVTEEEERKEAAKAAKAAAKASGSRPDSEEKQ